MSGARLLVLFLMAGVLGTAQCVAEHHQHGHRKASPPHNKGIESCKSTSEHRSLVPPKGHTTHKGTDKKKSPVPSHHDREKTPQHEVHKSPRKGATKVTKPPVGHEPQSPPSRNELPVKKLPPPGKKLSPMPPHKPPTTTKFY